jgi:putative serine protease PepD
MTESPTPEPRKRFPRTLTTFVAVAAVGAGVGVGAYAVADSNSSPAPAAAPITISSTVQPTALKTTSGSLIDLYKRTSPGVVDITVTSTTTSNNGFFNGQQQQQQQKAEGSGFVIDSKGDIVTNDHVVEGATSITVRFKNGTTTKATLVGKDAGTDLAVIKVDPSATTLTPLALGDSASVQTGQGVFAIGSPFGLADSLTAGIVSATGRTIQSPDNHPITNAIQTDAAINHGNSGGPLLDTSGNVIGVNSQIDSDSGGNDGVGFAIPSNTVKSITSQLIAGQKVAHPLLGVYIGDAPNNGGALVSKVTAQGPAANAGVKAGDTITAIDSTRVNNASDLEGAIAADTVGQKVTLTILRSGASATTTVQVTLGSTSA